MVIYGRPSYGVGKDIPAMGPFKNYNPRFVGPVGSKIKFGIIVGGRLGKYLLSRPWAKGTLTGTAIGTGLGIEDGSNETNVGTAGYNKAHAQYRKRGGSHRKYTKHRNRTSCCSNCCH